MPTKNATLQPLLHEWLLTNKKPTVVGRTFEKLMSNAKRNVYPYLGHLPVNQIDSVILQSFFSEYMSDEKKLSVATMKKCKYMLNEFFEYCCKNALISKNPLNGLSIKTNEVKKEKHKGIKPEDRQEFIDAVSTNRFWKPFCLTVMYTGIKIGELLPLKWKDIDFERKAINIAAEMSANIRFDDNGNILKRKHYICPTFGEKKIPLSNKAIAVLSEYKRYREREQRQQRKYSYMGADDLVFGNEKSELRSYSGISHLLEKFLRKKGLEGITFSTLRHTFLEMEREEKRELRKQKLLEKKAAEEALKNEQKMKAITKYKKVKCGEIEMT